MVELLVVIAIIGVLATLLLLQLGGARAKARDTKRVSDVAQLRTAIEQYFDDNCGTYVGGNNCAGVVIASLYDASNPLGPYLGTAMPTDPLDQAQYGYSSAPAVATRVLRFQIWAELENGSTGLRTDHDITTTGWTARSTGRMGVLTNGTDPVTGTCPDNNLAVFDCVFDVGVR